MTKLMFNRWFQVGATGIFAAVVGVLVGVLIAESETVSSVKEVAGTVATGEFSEDTVYVGPVVFTTGPSIPRIIDEYGGRPRASRDATDVTMPFTAAEAVAAGWKDPILCSPGRGRYFQKGLAGEGEPHFLMYNTADQLIGVYLFSEAEMPPPWERWDSLVDIGLTLIDFEHWGLFVYFQDASRACFTGEGAGVGAVTKMSGVVGSGALDVADGFGRAEMGGKSTPTPFVPPTPTPTADQKLSRVVARTAKVSALGFTLTGDPAAKKVEGTLGSKGELTLVKEGMVTVTDSAGTVQEVAAGSLPVSFDGLGATLSGIAAALQEPVEAKGQWVDSVSREGISGIVLGADLSALVPTAIADAPVAVSLWYDDRGRIVRLRIEGKVTPNDPTDAVRVLDLGAFSR